MTGAPQVPITPEQALNIARARSADIWKPLPFTGYSTPDHDTIGNSYEQQRHDGGWVFRPAIAGLEQDPAKGATYPFFVVRDDGEIATVPFEKGIETAVDLLTPEE